MQQGKLLSEYCLRDGGSDSCLETSICPPAFIPDHSYEIKFNKNLFLRRQRNEIQPFLNNWTQWDRTAEDTSCSTCISQVRHLLPQREFGNKALYFSYNCAQSAARASRRGCARLRGHSFVQPFQSESPSALLSEIGNPFSWTRFLASSGRGDRGDWALLPLEPYWTRTQLGVLINFLTTGEFHLSICRVFPIFYLRGWIFTTSSFDLPANRYIYIFDPK